MYCNINVEVNIGVSRLCVGERIQEGSEKVYIGMNSREFNSNRHTYIETQKHNLVAVCIDLEGFK